MSEWQALLAGIGFYLIFEGIMPFFNPAGFKRLLAMVLDIPDDQLRKFGAVMMVLGVILLFSIK